MESIKINKLVRSRRRTIALMITPEATLTVRAPLHTPMSYIEKLVGERSDWIRRKVAQVEARPKAQPFVFDHGVTFPYLGEQYPFELYDGAELSLQDRMFFPRALLPKAKEEMFAWYKQEASRIILERVNYFCQKMDVQYQTVRLSHARTRWGSCTSTGKVCFSWRLIMTPMHIIDYVVVHELAHLKVCNHSARFWAKVREACPSYQECRAWLRHNERLIRL